MAEVIDIGTKKVTDTTEEAIDPLKVLNGAIEQSLDQVALVGITKDGDLYLASSSASTEEMHWLYTAAAHLIMRESLGD